MFAFKHIYELERLVCPKAVSTVAENVCEGQAQTNITNRYFRKEKGSGGGGCSKAKRKTLSLSLSLSLSPFLSLFLFLLLHLYAE